MVPIAVAHPAGSLNHISGIGAPGESPRCVDGIHLRSPASTLAKCTAANLIGSTWYWLLVPRMASARASGSLNWRALSGLSPREKRSAPFLATTLAYQ